MKSTDITDPYMITPSLTSEGKPWIQRCFVCGKGVDLIKSTPEQRVKIDKFVRHSSCDPLPAI